LFGKYKDGGSTTGRVDHLIPSITFFQVLSPFLVKVYK